MVEAGHLAVVVLRKPPMAQIYAFPPISTAHIASASPSRRYCLSYSLGFANILPLRVNVADFKSSVAAFLIHTRSL